MALPIPTNHVKRLSEIDEIERKLAIEKALTLEKALPVHRRQRDLQGQQYWKLSQVKDRNGLTNAWPYQTQTQDNPPQGPNDRSLADQRVAGVLQ